MCVMTRSMPKHKITEARERRDEVINLHFTAEELERVDNFRFAQKFPSRNVALRFLIEFALKQRPSRV